MNIQGISTLFFVIVLYVQNIEANNLKPLLWNIDRLRLIKQNQKHIHGVQNLILEAEKIVINPKANKIIEIIKSGLSIFFTIFICYYLYFIIS